MRRVGSRAGFAVAAIGLVFAAYQVQGWKMPRLLAAVLIAAMLTVAGIAFLSIIWEAVQEVRLLLERRETSAGWIIEADPGLFDFEADGLRAMEEFTEELEKLSKDTQRIGKKLPRHSQLMERSTAPGVNGKMRQNLANRAAKDIRHSATFIKKRLDLLTVLNTEIGRNLVPWVRLMTIETDEDAEAAQLMREMGDSGARVTDDVIASLRGYRASVKGIEEQNASRSLRIAARELGESLDGIERVLRKRLADSRRLNDELERKLSLWSAS